MSGKNIDLGTFQWDTNKIEHQIAANNTEMNKFSATVKATKDQVKEQSKEIAILESKIESERKAQERMRVEMEKGYRSQESYNLEIEKSNQNLDQYIAEQIAVGKAQADNLIVMNRTQQATKDLRLENNELNKLLSAGRVELSQNENAYRDLGNELNALKIEAENLGAQMIILKREGKQGTDEYKSLAVQFAETSKKANDLNNDFKAIDHSVGDNHRTIGDYKEQIQGAFSEMTEGLSMMKNGDFAGGFDNISKGFKSVATDAKAMIATFLSNPVGIILAIVGGIAMGVNEVLKYNEQLFEANKLTASITKLQGELLDEATIKSQTLEEVLGLDRKETLESAKALVTQFGISYAEALQLIEDGAIRGGSANNEYLDSIREYPVFFAKAGFSAKQFIDLVNAGYSQGIYNDKLIDSLKEFDLSMREQTKSTRDALVNAFGASFSDDILKRVSSGKTTVKDALIEINKESEKYNLSQKQLGQLTADVFRGAGEDAGGFAKIMDIVTVALIEQGGEMTEIQKIIKTQIDSYNELGEEKNDALKSDEVLAFKRDMENAWIAVKKAWFIGVKELRSAINGIRLMVGMTVDYAFLIPFSISKIFTALKEDFSKMGGVVKSFGNVLKDVFTFNWDNLESSFGSFTNSLKAGFSNSIENAKNLKKAIVDIPMNNYNEIKTSDSAKVTAQRIIEERREKKEEKTTNNYDGAGTGTRPTPKDKKKDKIDNSAQKALEDEAKSSLDIARETANQMADVAKNELAEYISLNADKYKDDKTLLQKKLQDQLSYFDEVQRLQKIANGKEEESKILSVQQKVDELNQKKTLSQNELAEKINLESEIENIRNEYSLRDLELTKTTEAQKAEIQKNYDLQVAEQKKLQQAIFFQQKILDLESQGASEFEIQKVQQEQNFQQELADWAEKNDIKIQLDEEKYISDQEIISARKELENEIALTEDAEELTRLENKMSALNIIEQVNADKKKKITKAETEARLTSYGDLFGNVATLLGNDTKAGKTAALAQVAISQGLAIARIWEQKSILPSPFGAIQKVVETGIAVGNVIRAAGQINSVKAKKGMLISGNSHANGGVPISTPNGIIEAEGGEPILTKKAFQMFPGLISDINVAGGGVPLFASGGIVPSKLSTVQNSITNNNFDFEMMASVMREAVMEGSALGTHSGSQSGISDLSENRKIANGANF